MPITDLLERNAELYGSDVALVEVNPEITVLHGRNMNSLSPIPSVTTDVRSHGRYLTKRQTVSQICSLREAYIRETRSVYFL